jgi:hypothetical protein
MTLFRIGSFVSHSMAKLPWKIECDALDSFDWETLAVMAVSDLLPAYGVVEGIPSGGLKLAAELQKYATKGNTRLLIVDDVCTTGKSLEDHRAGRDALGLVAFSRGNTPWWVIPIFTYAAKGGTPQS